jgi:[acyl-carrier-protein] S-malonyltransferase
LKETKVTQPVVPALSDISKTLENLTLKWWHSLGELSALVANGVLSFEDGLKLVSKELSYAKACEITPSTMAAVLGLADNIVEEVCASIDGVVVAITTVRTISDFRRDGSSRKSLWSESGGAKRALILPVGGAFHSQWWNQQEKS